MEQSPGMLGEEASGGFEKSNLSDKDSSKKKGRGTASTSSSSANTKAASPASETSETPKPKEQLSALEQALAHLATEARRAKAEADTESAEKPTGTDSADEEIDTILQATAESEDQTAEEWAEDLVGTYEIPLNHTVGEMIIDLNAGSEEPRPLVDTHEPMASAIPESTLEPAFSETPFPSEESNTAPLAANFTEATSTQSTAENVPYVNPTEVVQQPEIPVYFTQAEDPYLQQYLAAENNVANIASAPQSAQAERPATKTDVDDAVYRATKSGQNRGVVTGLLVGAGYEHFKHKRREKRTEKRHQETTKKLSEARKSYAFGTEQQIKQRAEYVAQTAESNQQLAASEKRLTALERQRQVHPVAEQMSGASAPKPHAEQARQQAQVPENEQLVVAPEHRLQTSSWHSIEVDVQTGRAVENPAFQYGHEYYREQAQENALGLPPAQDTLEQRTPAQSHDGSTSIASFGGSSLPPMYTVPRATPTSLPVVQAPVQPQPTSVPKANKVAAKPTQPASPIWPLILALLVVVICLSLALR
jgi:hypothetical protein